MSDPSSELGILCKHVVTVDRSCYSTTIILPNHERPHDVTDHHLEVALGRARGGDDVAGAVEHLRAGGALHEVVDPDFQLLGREGGSSSAQSPRLFSLPLPSSSLATPILAVRTPS